MKSKLYAIARDESAYLPEWVNYHFELGFDEIEIYLNNTTDNSMKILNELKKEYKNLKFKTVELNEMLNDEIKYSSKYFLNSLPLQGHSYNRMLLNHDENIDWVCFLDIDEFLYFPELNNVSEFIKNENKVKLSIDYLFVKGENKPFLHLSEIQITKKVNSYGKLIFKLSDDILLDDSHIFSDVNRLSLIHPKQKAFIIHRNFRSIEEYEVMALRGDCYNNYPFKRNRNGWSKNKNLFINHDFSKFKKSFDLMLKNNEILKKELNYSRENLLNQREKALNHLQKLYNENKQYQKEISIFIENTSFHDKIKPKLT